MSTTNESSAIPISEGEMVWDVPNAGKECKTWYRIYGNLKSGVRPLVVLHGGPGVTSDYLTSFSALTLERSIPVIIYDQLGNGLSTHLPEKMGDIGFWIEQLFLDELKHLLDHLGIYENYDLLGHSWGGMLGARHAVRQPRGLKHLVIMSSPASNKLWIEAQEVLRRKLPQDVQDVLDTCEREGKTDTKVYQNAVGVYYSRFLCTLAPMPESLQKSFEWMEKDPTVYLTMNGPSEFYMIGPIKDWTILDEVHKISVPTLLTNGRKDEAADSCMYPFFKLVPRVRWIQFSESSHMAHLEEHEFFFQVVGLFLSE
ncbi:proline imino-peptidase [Macrolepiota fuliginosa MF-IS2]|uniref:Proline imino-peptidase n=1 Tax=Macrolepiota fuliginosa MF-IS2 TaxID=1400762 RepID=A0A9P5XAJ6_9AGAR|nr:proline imino-peptidase [Macrolepiota fuliginosa MF-IS2]